MIIPLGVGRHQYSNFALAQGERQHLWESDAAVLFAIMSVKPAGPASFLCRVHVRHKTQQRQKKKKKTYNANGELRGRPESRPR